MDNGFYALIGRMRYISRWGLMRNTEPENVQEHSHMVAVLAHALALIDREILKNPDAPEPADCAAAALFHDASEILTGDLATPIKYYSPAIRGAYRQVEEDGCRQLLDMLPQALRSSYAVLLHEGDDRVRPYVKAADKLAAYIKCIEEQKTGNAEFDSAARQTRAALERMAMPSLDYFLSEFLDSFKRNLDEIGGTGPAILTESRP